MPPEGAIAADGCWISPRPAAGFRRGRLLEFAANLDRAGNVLCSAQGLEVVQKENGSTALFD